MAEKPIKVELEVTTDTTEAKNSIETVQKSIEDLKIYAEQPVKITVAPDPSGPLSDIFIDAAFDATNIIVGVDDLMNDLIKSSDFNPLKIIQIAEDVKELTETLGRLDDIKSTYDLITQENEEFTASIRATGKESQLLSDYYQDQVKSITDMQGDAAQSARLIGELSINEVERLDEVGTALFAKREQKLKDHEALVARIAASQEGVWSLVEDNIPEEMERTAKNLYALLEEVEKTSGADFSSTKETLLDQAAAIEASKGSLNAYNDAILDNAAQTLLAKSYMDDAKATLSGFGETLDNSSFSYYNLGKAAEIVQGKLTASTEKMSNIEKKQEDLLSRKKEAQKEYNALLEDKRKVEAEAWANLADIAPEGMKHTTENLIQLITSMEAFGNNSFSWIKDELDANAEAIKATKNDLDDANVSLQKNYTEMAQTQTEIDNATIAYNALTDASTSNTEATETSTEAQAANTEAQGNNTEATGENAASTEDATEKTEARTEAVNEQTTATDAATEKEAALVGIIAEYSMAVGRGVPATTALTQAREALTAAGYTEAEADAVIQSIRETEAQQLDALMVAYTGLTDAELAQISTGRGMEAQAAGQVLAMREEAAVLENVKAAMANYTEIATNALSGVPEAAELSLSQLKENLEENQKAVAEWSTNLGTLAEAGIDEGLLSQLESMGLAGREIIAELVKSIENGETDVVDELNTLMENGADVGLEAAKDRYGEIGENILRQTAEGFAGSMELESGFLTKLQNMQTIANDNVSVVGFDAVGKNMVDTTAQGMEGAQSTIEGSARTVGEAAKSTMAGFASQYAQIGRQMMAGINLGIAQGRATVINAVKSVALAAIKAAKAALGIASPSKVMAEIGHQTWEGFIQGMDEELDAVIKKSTEAANSMVEAVDAEIQKLRDEMEKRRKEKQKEQENERLKDLKNAIVDAEKELAKAEKDEKEKAQEDLAKAQKAYNDYVQELHEKAVEERMREEIAALEAQKAAIEKAAKEEQEELRKKYEADKAALEAMIDANERYLEERKKQHEEEMALLEEAREKYIENLNDTGEAIMEALKNRYKEQLEAEKDALDAQLTMAEEASKQRIELLEEEHDKRSKLIEEDARKAIDEIQKQIDALDALDKAQEAKDAEAEYLREVADREREIANAKTRAEKAAAEEALRKLTQDYQRKLTNDERDAQRDALEAQQEAIEREAEAKQEALEADLEAKIEAEEAALESTKAHYDQQKLLLEEHYNQKMSAQALYHEAEKMIVNNQQEEIYELLKSYNTSWYEAGQDFGRNIIEGIDSMEESINQKIKDTLSALDHLNSLQNSMNQANTNYAADVANSQAGVDDFIHANAVANTITSAVSSSNVTNNNTTSVTFNRPVDSPAEIVRQVENVSRRLALGY